MKPVLFFTLLALFFSLSPLLAEETPESLVFRKSYGTKEWGYRDGNINQAIFNKPQGMLFIDSRTLWVADTFNNCIRQIEFDSPFDNAEVTTVLGQCGKVDNPEPMTCDTFPNVTLTLLNPTDLTKNNGYVYILDSGNRRVLLLKDGSLVNVLFNNECDPLSKTCLITNSNCQLQSATAIYADQSGMIYVADSGHHRILSVDLDNDISLVAGNGEKGYEPSENNAQLTKLNTPTAIFPYYNGVNLSALFFADSGNGQIRQLRRGENIEWLISSIAGSDNFNLKTTQTHTAQLFDLEKPYRMTSSNVFGTTTMFISQPTQKRIIGLTPQRKIFIAYEGENLEIPYAMAINKFDNSLWVFDSSGELKSFKIEEN